MRAGIIPRIAAAAALALAAVPAAGQSLTDALITAYQTSPLLEANRAGLRSLDESVPQARANRRPQVSATASGAFSTRARETSGVTDLYRAGLNASLVLFDNGQSRAALEAARYTVAAARADLKDVEQLVLFNAVQAFMDVRRDIEFVNLAESDVLVLEEQLRAARDRFEVGEITRTDVSLTEARLAASRSVAAASRGQLEISRAAYRAAVGLAPGALQPPPPLPQLPASLDEAAAIGLRQNPAIVAAQFAERAAVYDVDRARAASGLQVQADAAARWEDNTAQPGRGRDYVGELGVSASIPLYTGGRNESLTRQAQGVLERRQHELQEAGRSVALSVTSAWTQLEVARASIVARREQITAARIAAEGVAEEARLGARSVLDVLDADQERLQAEADLVQAVRDEYVAAYNLLSAMGLLTVEHLNLGIETYDPDVNFTRVRSGPAGAVDTSVVDRIRARWE